MLTDCIDPEAGGWVREITEKSISEILTFDSLDLGTVEEARLHWNSCPACRHEFVSVPTVMAQIGVELERWFRDELGQMKDVFWAQKTQLLAAAKDLVSAYPEIIAALVMAEGGVHETLARALRIGSHVHRGVRLDFDPYEQATLSNCREFICSLEPEIQGFVVAATLSFELLRPICERIDWSAPPQSDEEALASAKAIIESKQIAVNHESIEDLQQRLATAIAKSGVQPDALWDTVELAARAYTSDLRDSFRGNAIPAISQTRPSRTEVTSSGERTDFQTAIEEWKRDWKRDFDNLQDSVKAGHMELIRLYEHNSRRAADYEADITAQLGTSLYSKLQESTQRGLQVAEYLYHDRSEPNYFHGPVMQMALSFENELILRVVWPFVDDLRAAGVQTYDAHGRSKYPLILGGRFSERSMRLGNVARYLKEDSVMRSKVSALGFNVGAIASDAAMVNDLRNKAAHELFCERVAADELRRRILCRDGILSRLHPSVAAVGAAKH